MNLILTGERQIGKSTALCRFLSGYAGSITGFRTVFNQRNIPENRHLLLYPLPDGDTEAAVVWQNGRPEVNLSVFNRMVPPLLAQSADLLVMDELGKFEVNAVQMRRAVESAFNAERNVLAVVRLDAPSWMGALMQRRDVTVLTVTAENRDRIPAMLAKLLPQV